MQHKKRALPERTDRALFMGNTWVKLGEKLGRLDPERCTRLWAADAVHLQRVFELETYDCTLRLNAEVAVDLAELIAGIGERGLKLAHIVALISALERTHDLGRRQNEPNELV